MVSFLKQQSAALLAKQMEHDNFAYRHKFPLVDGWKEQRAVLAQRRTTLVDAGITQDQQTGSLFIGERSPNCKHCVQGRTQGVHLTDYCNNACSFCPQQRTTSFVLQRPLHYYTSTPAGDQYLLNMMEQNDSFGCGLSGGEPLLVFDKLLAYIQLLKQARGKQFWIHLYTNGKLLNRECLAALKKAGLDEIRIDVAAVHYQLDKVALVQEFGFYTVVEIPVVPHDREQLFLLLDGLDELALDTLNLHELVATVHNFQKLQKAGYQAAEPAFKVPFYFFMDDVPVAGSEELLLDLLETAYKKKVSYGVHYCYYQARLLSQPINKFKKIAQQVKRPYEQVTAHGLLKKLIVPLQYLELVLADLEKEAVPKDQIQICPVRGRLETSLRFLPHLQPELYEVAQVQSVPYGNFTDVAIKVL